MSSKRSHAQSPFYLRTIFGILHYRRAPGRTRHGTPPRFPQRASPSDQLIRHRLSIEPRDSPTLPSSGAFPEYNRNRITIRGWSRARRLYERKRSGEIKSRAFNRGRSLIQSGGRRPEFCRGAFANLLLLSLIPSLLACSLRQHRWRKLR